MTRGRTEAGRRIRTRAIQAVDRHEKLNNAHRTLTEEMIRIKKERAAILDAVGGVVLLVVLSGMLFLILELTRGTP
jgi:hypothetical protein